MPKTLDELRADLARGLGAHAPKDLREGVPDEDPPEMSDSDLNPKKGVDLAKMRARRRKGTPSTKYTIASGGDDAVLHFGKYSGSQVSDMAEESEGRDYLRWILRSGDFDRDLMDIVEYQLERDW